MTNQYFSFNSPSHYNSENSRSSFNNFDSETISNFKYLFDDEDDLNKDFERLRLSTTNQSKPINKLASGPNTPIIKQKSLTSFSVSPNRLSISHQDNPQKYSSNQWKTSFQSYRGVSNEITNQQHSPRSFNIWEDDNKEWFDQFGLEIDHQHSSSHDPLSEITSPKIQNIDRTFRFHETLSPGNTSLINNTQNTISPMKSSSFSSSTSSLPLYTPKHNNQLRPVTSKSVNTSPVFNLKHSSRIISIQKANLFSLETLISYFEKYGEIRSTNKINNMYLISYYDLRHAQIAYQNLNGKIINDTCLELGFYFLREFNNPEEANQGTLVIFNLDTEISINELMRIFGVYGEIREIRESPNKKHKFVEFYDIREAETAIKHLNKTEIRGKKIKIEPSRPGGNKSEMKDRKDPFLSNSAPSYPPSPLSIKLNGSHYDAENNHTNGTPVSPRSRSKLKIVTTAQKTSFKGNEYERKGDEYETEKNSDHSKYELSVSKIMAGEDTRTTLMIKNIPNKYDQEMLLTALNKNHCGLYDFFYLPIDFKNKCNVGYAFINFVNPLSIPSFYKEFNNNKWERFNSEKVCQISYARIQGKDAMIEHFRNSSLLFEDPKCQPLIFQSDSSGNTEALPMGINVRQRSKTSGSLKIKLRK